jgi:hypothetical protein
MPDEVPPLGEFPSSEPDLAQQMVQGRGLALSLSIRFVRWLGTRTHEEQF